VLERDGKLDPERAIAVLAQVASAQRAETHPRFVGFPKSSDTWRRSRDKPLTAIQEE
jgi:hypothetical protein